MGENGGITDSGALVDLRRHFGALAAAQRNYRTYGRDDGTLGGALCPADRTRRLPLLRRRFRVGLHQDMSRNLLLVDNGALYTEAQRRQPEGGEAPRIVHERLFQAVKAIDGSANEWSACLWTSAPVREPTPGYQKFAEGVRAAGFDLIEVRGTLAYLADVRDLGDVAATVARRLQRFDAYIAAMAARMSSSHHVFAVTSSAPVWDVLRSCGGAVPHSAVWFGPPVECENWRSSDRLRIVDLSAKSADIFAHRRATEAPQHFPGLFNAPEFHRDQRPPQ